MLNYGEMKYEGNFSFIPKVINTQEEIETHVFNVGVGNMPKLELKYLNDEWLQRDVFTLYEIIKLKDATYTKITKETFREYLDKLHFVHDIDAERDELLKEDKEKLNKLYDEFDWKNHTLLFCYWY